MFIEEGNEEKYLFIGNSFNPKEKEQLVQFLKENIDVFAWQPCDMSDIDSEVMPQAPHRSTTKPIKKKPP